MRAVTFKKATALAIAACLVAGTVGGCAKPGDTGSTSSVSSGQTGEKVDLSLPISKEPITLKYFINMNSAMSATMKSYADVAALQEMEKRTNIKIEWMHPASGSAGNEQFSVMIASSELPDIINWSFGNAKGGAEALLRDNKLIRLSNDDLYTYAPNYMKIMDNNPVIKRSTQLDDGTMYQFVNFNYDPSTGKTVDFNIKGPYIRMDWVKKVGMKAPTTIDELHDVLKAFKDQKVNGKDSVIPFIDDKSLTSIKSIVGSFGTRWDMHMQDGKVVYGPLTDNFKKYLETMNKWYNEGLINSDFPVLNDRNPLILSSDAGFTIGSMGSGLTMTRQSLQEKEPDSDLDSLVYLKGPDGYQSITDDKYANPRATAITSANKYVKETLRWLDYAYSKEGSLLTTFGIENKSYTMKDGVPTLTDAVMKGADGHSQEETIARYCLGPINYPNARDINFYKQVNLDTEQKERIQTNWKTGDDKIIMPPITLTTDESSEYAGIMSDISTYASEMILKFIIGKEPMSKYPDFVSNVKKMNIDRAIQIKEAAVKRYNERK